MTVLKRLFLTALFMTSPAFALAPFTLPQGVLEERFITEAVWRGFEKSDKDARPRVILVLGGGGAKGLSHIGVLRVLREEHIPVDEVVGVSVGALIGSLYAAGLSDIDLETMASDIGWNKLSDLSVSRAVNLILNDELLSTTRMEDYFEKHIGATTFADLKIPFSCVATDVRTGEKIVLREGSVAFAARASATIPGIFKPVPFRQRLLVDGGLVDNLPTDLVTTKRENDVVVAVLPKSGKLPAESFTVFRSMSRAIDIQGAALMQKNRDSADFVIEPVVGDVGIADLKRSRECIDAGTVATRAAALPLKKLLIAHWLARQSKRTPN